VRAHRMVLPVRMRIHWGMGLFCFCFLPRIFLVLKVFWDGCGRRGGWMGMGESVSRFLSTCFWLKP
jgi:Na+(H+)/acetate symporter ActP